MQELWFLCSAHHLMLIDIYIKFYEHILNCFQVTERTGFSGNLVFLCILAMAGLLSNVPSSV